MSEQSIPEVTDQSGEPDYWEIHDSAEYMDWLEQSQQQAEIKSSEKTIPLHLPQALWDALQAEAGLRNIPCQALIENWLREKLDTL